MASWCFNRKENKLCLIQNGDDKGEVDHIETGKHAGYVRVIMKNEVVKRLCLEKFDCSGSIICQKMKVSSSPESRSGFVKRWRKYLKADSSCSSSNESTDSETVNDLPSSDSTAEWSDDFTTKEATATDIQDRILRKHFLGTFDVHVQNLVPPAASRATRVVDHEHVTQLSESFQEHGLGQVVILVGMVTDDVDVDDLRKHTSQCKVEVLGGNHTREALQSLNERGILDTPTVKVNLYKNLPRTEALAIGYQHNVVLHEKKKPMSFIDKVRLMRSCKQEEVVGSWKDMLVLVFRQKDRRSMQHKLNTHLLMAEIPEMMWSKVVRHGEVNEKFYRQLVRLNDEKLIDCCLDVLLSDGVAKFNSKVKQFIDEGHLRSKKKVKKVSNRQQVSTDSMEIELTNEDVPEMVPADDENAEYVEDNDTELSHLRTAYSAVKAEYLTLQEKYERLQAENETLKKQLKSSAGNRAASDVEHRGVKRFREITAEEINKGDKVEAFWRYEDSTEEWLEATVVTVYADGKYVKVRYELDQATCRIQRSWVRQTN